MLFPELAQARELAARAFAAELAGNIEERTRAIGALIAAEPAEVVSGVAGLLGRESPKERSLAAHMFGQMCEVSAGENVVEELLSMLDDETDPEVVAPLLTALGHSRRVGVLGRVLSYLHHPSSDVRYAVSDAIPKFAPDLRVAAALVELAHDSDPDVRWSAVFELGSWLTETDDTAIAEELARIAKLDPDAKVRAQAEEGFN